MIPNHDARERFAPSDHQDLLREAEPERRLSLYPLSQGQTIALHQH